MQERLIVIFLAVLVSSDNQKCYLFKKANFKQLSEFRHENNKFTLKISIFSVSQKKSTALIT